VRDKGNGSGHINFQQSTSRKASPAPTPMARISQHVKKIDQMKPEKNELTISKDLYLDDGNIVLDVVEGTNRCRWRVHKSVLARSSDFFADMFRVPQPAADEELEARLVDGCPFIELTGDKINDWTIILDALYSSYVMKLLFPSNC
jgi:hypothetical protein